MCPSSRLRLVLGLLYSLILTEVKCEKFVKLNMPDRVPEGESTQLICHYNTDGEPLYTLKWYLNGREFYRVNGKYRPKLQQFPIPGAFGIDVSIHQTITSDTHINLFTSQPLHLHPAPFPSNHPSECSAKRFLFIMYPLPHAISSFSFSNFLIAEFPIVSGFPHDFSPLLRSFSIGILSCRILVKERFK